MCWILRPHKKVMLACCASVTTGFHILHVWSAPNPSVYLIIVVSQEDSTSSLSAPRSYITVRHSAKVWIKSIFCSARVCTEQERKQQQHLGFRNTFRILTSIYLIQHSFNISYPWDVYDHFRPLHDRIKDLILLVHVFCFCAICLVRRRKVVKMRKMCARFRTIIQQELSDTILFFFFKFSVLFHELVLRMRSLSSYRTCPTDETQTDLRADTGCWFSQSLGGGLRCNRAERTCISAKLLSFNNMLLNQGSTVSWTCNW